MPFLDGNIVVKQLDDNRWAVVESITYVGRQDTFTIKEGFETDFASVPRPLIWLLPRYGRYTKAAILHDFLWREAEAGRFNRFDADGIFRRAMRELGVPFARRYMMWAAVRLASWVKSVQDLVRPGLWQFLLVLLVAVPSIAFVAVPAVVILVWQFAFWLFELLIFVILKPFSPRKPINRPQFLWKLS